MDNVKITLACCGVQWELFKLDGDIVENIHKDLEFEVVLECICQSCHHHHFITHHTPLNEAETEKFRKEGLL